MSPGERYSEYDKFAWFYRKDWGAEYHLQAREAYERIVFPRLREGARVLDLCCGTGDLSRVLFHRGYTVTGLDGSEEMLRYARQGTPTVEFLAGDARTFSFPPVFQAVLSTFDSLNHVIVLDELERVFANAYRALAPGGFLFFDLNMEASFVDLWNGTWATVGEDEVCITKGSYDALTRTGCAAITVFRLKEHWERSDVRVLERCYSEDEVRSALKRAGFSGIERYAAADLGMCGDVGYGRDFFFGLKRE